MYHPAIIQPNTPIAAKSLPGRAATTTKPRFDAARPEYAGYPGIRSSAWS